MAETDDHLDMAKMMLTDESVPLSYSPGLQRLVAYLKRRQRIEAECMAQITRPEATP